MSQFYYIHPHTTAMYRGEPVEIDDEIYGLMDTIWKLGINTLFCCQETTPGIAYIMFECGIDADVFASAVALAFGEGSYMDECMSDPRKEEWRWYPTVYKSESRWVVQFPKRHIKTLEDRLRSLL